MKSCATIARRNKDTTGIDIVIAQTQNPIDSGFEAKSSPGEVLAGIDLSGKTAIVTGGYSGIGVETVRALDKAGADVCIPARDVKRAAEALQGIVSPEQIAPMDLSDLNSVRTFAADFAAQHDRLDILIANAGVMACPEQRTPQGWEWQMAVNHFGHFTLVRELLPLLSAAGGARLVTLSSIAHRLSGMRFDDMHFQSDEYNKWVAYGQSKTAQALMAVELDRRYADRGIRACGVHPGGIFTPLQRHLPQEEMVALGWIKESGEPSDLAARHFKTPAQGATTSLWAATSPQLSDIGGVYCEDCNIAQVVADDDPGPRGVRSWAVDSDQAQKLWEVTEAALAQV